MIILLAGLQSIPDELYEAARIDGAGAWAQFRHVTLPALAPIMLVFSILTIAGYFQLFAEPYVMTQGGPVESTTSILYMLVDQGFRLWNLGFARALAVVLFAFMFSLPLPKLASRPAQRRVGKEWDVMWRSRRWPYH